MPRRGKSVNEEYNALRHDCQEIIAAERQEFLNSLFDSNYGSINSNHLWVSGAHPRNGFAAKRRKREKSSG
jgi:hypothetical protein